MAYNPGTADNIIVGAAAFFVAKGTIDSQPASVDAATGLGLTTNGHVSAGSVRLPAFVTDDGATADGEKYSDYVSDINSWNNSSDAGAATLDEEVGVAHIGYTTDGLELTITPDFGDVVVDQVLDSARLFKQGMTAAVKTTVSESTLENLMYALAYDQTITNTLDLEAGGLGDCPTERGFVATGFATGDCDALEERVYIGYRGMSTEAVTVSAKRDTPSQFDINLRLLPHTFTVDPGGTPEVSTGSYGRIVDRNLAR